jgi:cyclic pyranopterin phosphate synthase
MCCGVPGPAQVVEQLPDLGREDTRVAESVQEVELALLGGCGDAKAGGDPASEHLPELPELDQAGAGVIAEVALSTNATKLERYAMALRAAGLKRVNVSLDTLNPRQFQEITRGGSLARTMAGLDAAEQAGLTPVKVNAVIMKGINDDQVLPLVELGARRGWQVRFIEYMPIGCSTEIWDKHYVPAATILETVRQRFPLEELPMRGGAPARIYRVVGSDATMGVITPVSQHFCDSCNRMRLTADGKIRSCLLVEGEADLREQMRSGCSDEVIADLLVKAAALKPEWHGVTGGATSRATLAMREIGG